MASVAFAAPEEDRVLYLPEMGYFDKFAAFSGYVDIKEQKKRIHYMFVESQTNPSTQPLIVWFNGGPGCSSMLGFTQEHGPYVINDGTTQFVENEWTWNSEANMLYIEQPAGVGFSYCEGEVNCTFDDSSSAADNLKALLGWYEKFPEFKSNDLYISGESYAGIYVPYLAHNIDQHNTQYAADDTVFKPNLKGFMVGNGVTNWDYDTTNAYVDMAFWHSLYEEELYDQFVSNQCDFNGPYYTRTSDECFALLDEFDGIVSNVNVYDIFGICYGSFPYPQQSQGSSDVLGKKTYYTAQDYTPWLKRPLKQKHLKSSLPPCTWGTPLQEWMNKWEVRSQLNIPAYIQAWQLCTDEIEYIIEPKGSQWIYEELKGKYRMLFYSGDVDGAVPTIGS
jgi:hypothetical protein